MSRSRPPGARLRYELRDGQRRLPADEALRVFQVRTGRLLIRSGDSDPDPHLHLLLAQVASGLDAEARGDRRDFVAARDDVDGVRPVGPRRGRGHPTLSPRLVRAIGDFVAEVGSANAALAMLLAGHDRSRAFPVAKAPPPGQPRDARLLVRRLQKRLSDIARAGRELPATGVRVFGRYD